MTENLKLGNENFIETEGENDSVVIVDNTDATEEVDVETCVDEEIVPNENPQDETETDGDTADQPDNSEPEDENPADENPKEDEPADENPTADDDQDAGDNDGDVKDNDADADEEKMSQKEKIILIIVGIILLILLILLGIWGFNKTNRGSDLREVNSSDVTSISQTDEGNSEDTDNYYLYGHEESSNNGVSSNNDGDTTSKPARQPLTSDKKPNGGGDGIDDADNGYNSQDTDTNSNVNDSDTDGKDTDADDKGTDNAGNGNGTNTDKDKETDENNNKVPDYTGETKIHITKVNDDTGVITITVDGEKISVPVQTTVFNGRVTKSGVSQGKIFGFECGATVMIYYPQSEGMGTTEFTGYMSRINNSLTILVDINGEKSKMLIKINGFKSLK